MTGAVLIGGRARRLGGLAKGLIELDGVTIVQRLVTLLGETCADLLLVGSSPAAYTIPGTRRVPDLVPDRGAPGGVHAALAHSAPGYVLVVACDLPCLDAASLAALVAAPDADVCLYVRDGRLEPLVARWHTRALPTLARAVESARPPGFSTLLAGLEVVTLPAPRGDVFANVNSPADLEAVRASRRA